MDDREGRAKDTRRCDQRLVIRRFLKGRFLALHLVAAQIEWRKPLLSRGTAGLKRLARAHCGVASRRVAEEPMSDAQVLVRVVATASSKALKGVFITSDFGQGGCRERRRHTQLRQ
jgi:hypothetical protein